MRSAIYEGRVTHVRTTPSRHAFELPIGMVLIDLDEWDDLFRGSWLWGQGRFAPFAVRRRDHLGDPREPLGESVRNWMVSMGRPRPEGPIEMLAFPANFGFSMKPVSFFFCRDASGAVESVVAEVGNTPWNERQCYVLDPRAESAMVPIAAKAMHVSPFLPMELDYGWRLEQTTEEIGICFNCLDRNAAPETAPILSVTMRLERRDWNRANLRRFSTRYGLIAWKIWAGIYWQAWRLKRKRVPFYPHPRTRSLNDLSKQEAWA